MEKRQERDTEKIEDKKVTNYKMCRNKGKKSLR